MRTPKFIFILLYILYNGVLLAQPNKNSYIVSEKYDEDPRNYCKYITDFKSKVLIDRQIGSEALAEYNGVTQLKTCMYSQWKNLYSSIQSSHNDEEYLSELEKLDSYVDHSKFIDKVYPISVLNFQYSRLKQAAITSHYYENGPYLFPKSFYPNYQINNFEENRLFSASVLSDIVVGSTVSFVFPSALYFRDYMVNLGDLNDPNISEFAIWDSFSMEVDFGDGNGYIAIVPNQVLTVSYSNTSKWEILKFKFKSTTPFSTPTTNTYFAQCTFLRKGTATVPIVECGRNGVFVNARTAPPTADCEIMYPNNNLLWTEPINSCSQTKRTICFQTNDYTQLLQCHIYFKNNSVKKLRRPIIVVDGFDPGDARDLRANTIKYDSDMPRDNDSRGLYELFNGDPSPWYADKFSSSNLISSLRQRGYDIVFINWKDGAGDIRSNGELLRSFIKDVLNGAELRDSKTEEMVLIGPSMGGLITRYALATMERAGETHNVRTWISFDSPHKGAYIPISLQHTANVFKDIKTAGIGMLKEAKRNFQSAIYKLNTPAARQMLLMHYETYNINNNTCGPYPTFYDLYNHLNQIGYPTTSKNYGITNGGTFNLYTSGSIQNIDFKAKWVNWMWSKGTAMSGNQAGFCDVTMVHRLGYRHFVTNCSDIGHDNATGGWNSALYSLNCNTGNVNKKSDQELAFTRSCFISTASALGLELTMNNAYTSWKNTSTTPFDVIQGADGFSEEHVTITPTLADYLLKRLDEDLSNNTRPFLRAGKSTSIVASRPVSYHAKQSLTLAGGGNSLTIPANGITEASAGTSITLEPGFEAKLGSNFVASIAVPSAARHKSDQIAWEDEPHQVIDYNQPSPYLGQIWDYSDPDNPRLVNSMEKTHESTNNKALLATPNPFQDKVWISLHNPSNNKILYEVFDANGKLLIKEYADNSNIFELNMVNYYVGLYLVKVTVDNVVYTKKIIKQ